MKNLSEKSILVSLIVSQWTAKKYDKKATSEVNSAHNAKDAGRFNKALIAKEHLGEIQKAVNAARTFHYENTLPWNDSGERLLPAENYFTYCGELSKLKMQFEHAVNSFTLEYPSLIDEARQNLNGLFNPNEYPLDVREKFNFKTTFMPVPETTDLRINLSDSEVFDLTAQISEEMNSRFAKAQLSIYERIADQLKHMFERLSDKEASFKNSLFENVKDLVSLLPRLNVANDKNITAMCNDLNALYCDAENVRNDKALRAQKANEVETMLNKLNGFLTPAI